MSVDVMADLDKKLEEISDMDIKKEMSRAIQTVRSAAVLGCPVNDGELRQNIFAEVYQENDTTTGICWTNKEYALFVEFGTGPKGQENHNGISPDVNPVYSQQGWWIHESQIDERTAEKYRWFHIDTPDGRFYQCTGQPAQPFMYSALRDNHDAILKDLKTDFIADIRKVIK